MCVGGGGNVRGVLVCGCGCGWVGRCVCVCAQCVCSVGVMYCVSVHVLLHGASKQLRKRENEDSKSTGKKMIGVPMNGFEPTPSLACKLQLQLLLWLNGHFMNVITWILHHQIENLSGITPGSPMVGTPIILAQRPISPGQIEDLWIMVAGGRCSLVAEHWYGMPMALGLIPGSFTFLSCFFSISEVFGCNGMIQMYLIRPALIGLVDGQMGKFSS